MASLFDGDSAAVVDFHHITAIDGEEHGALGIGSGGELDYRAIGDNEGSVTQAVWADRRDDKDIGFGRNQGASCREGVGCGAGSCGDDESVCAVMVEEFSIHPGI